MLLGLFLLIAEYTNPKLWEEGETGGLQGDAELLGKEKEEKERRREKGVEETVKYNFKNSGIGNSWLIGTDTTNWANAYAQGRCEIALVIPQKLTDESGNTKIVEVIGQYAFYRCGHKQKTSGGFYIGGRTRSIVLSRYIKVIKYLGLGEMYSVTSFRIEEGSCLESIESYGLTGLGNENTNDNARRSILVLPSTVTSIAGYGFGGNCLFKTIYYCGSTHLSNFSNLNFSNFWTSWLPEFKVTSSYKFSTIFGSYTPNTNRESVAETEKNCRSYGFVPKASPSRSPSPSPSHSRSPSPSHSRSPLATPSRSKSPTYSPSPTASFKPTAGYQERGKPLSFLKSLSRAGQGGRRGVGSLRHGKLQISTKA